MRDVWTISATKPVTFDTLDARAYLLANSDVAAAGMDAATHFKKYGQHEGRRQLNLDFATESADFRRQKFARFREFLNLPDGAETFPVAFDGKHYELSDYRVESANGEYPPFVEEMGAHPDRSYLDLGCGLRHVVFMNCLYVEVYPSLTADLVVGPDCTYPMIRDEAFDGIGCFAVLEHTRKPWLVVQEIWRMLKPGGKVWIDWPFLQPVHGYPSHYFNSTREGVRTIFEDAGFAVERLATESFQGPDYALRWQLNELLQSLPLKTRERLGKMTLDGFLSSQAGSPFWQDIISQLDAAAVERLAAGNTLVARKK